MRQLKAPRTSQATRDFIAEMIGTFILVFVGQAAYTSFELTGTQSSESTARLAATCTCYGIAYLFAALLTISVSGAHLNPAYTFSLACYGNFSWHRVPTYMIAQYCGAFVAASFVHATYNDKIAQRHAEGLLNGMNTTMRAHGNLLSTGKFFTTYPPIDVSLMQMFISHTMATCLLCLLLLACNSNRTDIRITTQSIRCPRMPRFFQPILMGLALVCVLATFSANGGPCVNPAADFSPRFYASISGWGSSAFNLFHYTYWWICGIIAPHLGALLGCGAYQIIELLHADQQRAQIYSLSQTTNCPIKSSRQNDSNSLIKVDSIINKNSSGRDFSNERCNQSTAPSIGGSSLAKRVNIQTASSSTSDSDRNINQSNLLITDNNNSINLHDNDPFSLSCHYVTNSHSLSHCCSFVNDQIDDDDLKDDNFQSLHHHNHQHHNLGHHPRSNNHFDQDEFDDNRLNIKAMMS